VSVPVQSYPLLCPLSGLPLCRSTILHIFPGSVLFVSYLPLLVHVLLLPVPVMALVEPDAPISGFVQRLALSAIS
jgi:hypothetical protein